MIWAYVLSGYFIVGFPFAYISWRLFLRGDFDDMLPIDKVHLEMAKKWPFSLMNGVVGWITWPVQASKLYARIGVLSMGHLKIDNGQILRGPIFTPHRAWVKRRALLSFFTKAPLPQYGDSTIWLGRPVYPDLPGKIGYQITTGFDGTEQVVWGGSWTVEQAQGLRDNLDAQIKQREGFNFSDSPAADV